MKSDSMQCIIYSVTKFATVDIYLYRWIWNLCKHRVEEHGKNICNPKLVLTLSNPLPLEFRRE